MSKQSQQSLGEFVIQVRQYLRDFQELNRLIDGEETSDRMIAFSIMDALDDINNSPPFIGAFTVETFPFRSLLLRGAVLTILESVGMLQTRNQLNFSDGGIQVSVSDKSPMLMNWITMLRGTYEQKKQQYKMARNIETAMGGHAIISDYYFLGGYYDIFDRTHN